MITNLGTYIFTKILSYYYCFTYLLPIPALEVIPFNYSASRFSYSFAVRIIPVWNSLPNDVVTAANIYLFKTGI